jgi:hypothetical protein
MNTFYEHHQDSIRFAYRCFDRILLNGLIQPFQQPARVVGFFNTYRELYPVSKTVLRDIATQYEHWVKGRAAAWAAPILDAPTGRRDEFVEPYFRRAQPDQIVVILKAREPARILVTIGKNDRWHLEYKRRWVNQYNFYLHDRNWGRMFVRVCPYFPFSARLCLNQHHWLAQRMTAEGLTFRRCANAFVQCRDPIRLQALADSLTPRDFERCGHKWLRALVPFFTSTERRQAACGHRLFFAQVEYCDNLIFRRRARSADAAAVQRQSHHRAAERDHDHLRPQGDHAVPGQAPNGHRRPQPAQSRHPQLLPRRLGQAVRPGPSRAPHRAVEQQRTRLWRAQSYRPAARAAAELGTITDAYLTVQQDILETLVDRGQLRQLAAPTQLAA